MLLRRKVFHRHSIKISSCTSRFSSTIGTLPIRDKPHRHLIGNLGQPTSWTHPHLLKDGDVVLNIKADEFKERRTRIMQGILKHSINIEPRIKKHAVVVPSAVKKYMSDKIPYVFRQNSDFLYLTGCLEPDSILLMTISGTSEPKSTLFMRPKDKQAELWDGVRTGVENSINFFGVDEAYSINQFTQIMNRETEEKSHTAIWYDQDSSEQLYLLDILKAIKSKIPLKSPAMFLQGMRLLKSPAEIELIKESCRIATEAVNEVICEAKPGISEHKLFAMVDYKCRMKNASYLAYPPVVAAGNNATTIHYINNTQLAQRGDLVLMDAGCEYGGYASDITRTWPIDGQFNRIQKLLYDIVLQVQKDVIKSLMNENADTLNKLFEVMCVKLGKYLKEAGVLKGYISSDADYAKAAYQVCPHHVSHYLGMDVHDTPLMSRNIRLQPGMVFTIEPGIYIGHDRSDISKDFRGIGIRIEDDVYINETGNAVVLTADCVKDRETLERVVQKRNR